tara:strand:+ start:2266 stop:3192 length:927 start_codon:yes stop_codon:yes gene_type:complete
MKVNDVKKAKHLSNREAYLNRLKTLIDEIGGIKAFANKTEVPYQTVRQYLKNSEPTRPVLVKICEKLDINLDWLLQGKQATDLTCGKESTYFRQTLNNFITSETERTRVANTAQINIHRMDEIMSDSEPTLSEAIRLAKALKNKVPLLLNHSIGDQIHIIPEFDFVAYNELINKDFDFKKYSFSNFLGLKEVLKQGSIGKKKEEIRRNFNCNPEHLAVYRMHDHSMHPDAPLNSLLYIDLSHYSIQHDKLFLFRIDGQPSVRTALKLKTGDWSLAAYNKDTSPIIFPHDQLIDFCSIIGKVVGLEKMV